MSDNNEIMTEEEKSLYEAKRVAMFQAINRMKTSTGNMSINSSQAMIPSFSVDQIDKFMKNPQAFQNELRILSNFLYDYSPEYRQIIDYMSTLPKFEAIATPLFTVQEDMDWDAVGKAQMKVFQQLNKMSLPHELLKVSKTMWKQDTFFGYEHETKDSFMIQHMDANYCRLLGQDIDGVLLYEFDFTYFDEYPELLPSHPKELQDKYKEYLKTNNNWIPLNPNNAMAFKVNEEILTYPLLPYGVLFAPILDLEEYKKLQKARAKMDNFMLLTQLIPINDKKQSMDEFLISLEIAESFHNAAVAGLGEDGIGMLTSPMEIKAIRTEKSGNDKDNVSTALRAVYDAGGLTQFLFNSDKATSTGVSKSLMVDEQRIFKIYRQMERWLNRKLRNMSGKYKFKARFLDITNFDDTDGFDVFLKGAQNGFPSIEEASASIGINQMDLHNKIALENSPLSLQAKMKPLATSFTQSSKDSEGGRPSVSEDDATDSTITWRESDSSQPT